MGGGTGEGRTVRTLRLNRTAQRNLAEITIFIAAQSGSRRVAECFISQVRQKCGHLASLPATMGRDRSELRPGLRNVAFRNYAIFFRYVGDTFEVLNVLDRYRDIRTGLPDDAS